MTGEVLFTNISNPISLLSGKTDVSGYGTYPIFTKAKNPTNDIVINNVSQITITTEYPNA